MDIVTLTAFEDEMEKIALDAEMLARISAKAAKRGWSPAREMHSAKQLMRREGNLGQKAIAAATPKPGLMQRAKDFLTNAPKQPGQAPRPAPFRFKPEQAHRQGSLVKQAPVKPSLKITPQPAQPVVMGGAEGGTNPGVLHESIRRAA